MYNLFLDDFRFPQKATSHPSRRPLLEVSNTRGIDWVIVRNFNEFVETINSKGMPAKVSFDHDLCEEHMLYYHAVTAKTGEIDYSKLQTPTGVDAAEFLVDLWRREGLAHKPEVFIHSANPAGRFWIAKALKPLLN